MSCRHLIIFLLTILLVTLLACEDPEAPIPVPETFDTAEIAALIAESYCAGFRRCRSDVRPQHVLHYDVCVSDLGRTLRTTLNGFEDAVLAGRVTYQPSALARCVSAIQRSSCQALDLEAFESACADVTLGAVAEGEVCQVDAECQGGFCPGDDGCRSTCRPLSQRGESCSTDGDVQCAAGLDCFEDDRCYPKEEVHFRGGLDQLCHVHPCRSGLKCINRPEPRCTAFSEVYGGTEGGACRAGDEAAPLVGCQADLVCSFPEARSVDGDGVCRPLPRDQEVCHLTVGGSSAWCEPGHFCRGLDPVNGQTQGQCTPFPNLGEPCGDFYGSPRQCAPDHFCEEGVCAIKRRPGESCRTNRECADGLCIRETCTIDCVEGDDLSR